MPGDSALKTLIVLQFVFFLLPTVIAWFWGGTHHWDLPNELDPHAET